MGIWDFIQDEILGMKWLNRLIGSVLNACGLDTSRKIGGSVQFFIYDVIKIMVLLGVLIFLISYIQSYFPPERTKKILGRFHGIGANCVAALLGTVTPFCRLAWYGHTVLLLFVDTVIHRLHKCWTAVGSDILIPDLIANG